MAKLFSAALWFRTEKRHLSEIFWTEQEIVVLKLQTSHIARITTISVTFYLFLKLIDVQFIFRHSVF